MHGQLKINCQLDLLSEWELYLESGNLFLDVSGDLDRRVDELGFATDLLFLHSYLRIYPESG